MASKLQHASELKFGARHVDEFECSFVHDQAEDLQANIHQHYSTPFVGVGQATSLQNWYTLTLMPLLVVSSSANEEVIDMVACRMWSRLALHICLRPPLVGHRRESGCFSNLQL